MIKFTYKAVHRETGHTSYGATIIDGKRAWGENALEMNVVLGMASMEVAERVRVESGAQFGELGLHTITIESFEEVVS